MKLTPGAERFTDLEKLKLHLVVNWLSKSPKLPQQTVLSSKEVKTDTK